MQRIPSLLQKLIALQKSPQPKTLLDLDLMLDYTRVLYADLLDWRRHLLQQPLNLPQPGEPTLDELTEMMEEKLKTAGEGDSPGAEAPLSSMARKLDIAVPFRRPAAPPAQEPALPAPPPVTEKPLQAQPPPAEMPPVQKEYPLAPEPEAPLPPAPPPAAALPPLPLAEKPDLRHRIGINDKYQFISELFGNDPAGYESAMTALSRLESLREAERWMRENLLLSERAEDSDALEAFREILEGFYRR